MRDKKGRFILGHHFFGRKSVTITVTCHNCGKKYKTRPCDIKNNKNTYCSKYCLNTRIRTNNKIQKECIKCNSIFYIFPSSKQIYCSKKCANLNLIGKVAWNKGLKGFNAKEKHPNWKGGITDIDTLERKRFQKSIQKLVFERDSYKCTKCGKGGDLQVDHIQPWAEYIELRFDINNCRTLCASCHYELTYGRKMPEYINGWGHNLLERVWVTK